MIAVKTEPGEGWDKKDQLSVESVTLISEALIKV